jgi:glutamate-1-semialdehyde 2,1-aminomutase
MPWMLTWPMPFPLYFDSANGAALVDVDGNEYVDFCLGDSAAMGGHSPAPVAEAIAERSAKGMTAMLPTEDAIWVGEELTRRFGLESWQFTLSATDANRNAIRYARQITGREKVLIFNYAYHGTVDESLVMKVDGQIVSRRPTIGSAGDPARLTTVVEFNDAEALEFALAQGDVACVLTEPALTNIGIVLPAPGFHDEVRRLATKYGSLLVVDETHTMCAGPGGATRVYGIAPDLVVMGKWIAGGVPSGVLGMTADVARLAVERGKGPIRGLSGVGSTVAGNALCLAAMRAMLEHVLTDEAFSRMTSLTDRWSAGVQDVIGRARLPWHVVQLGGRAEYRYLPSAPVNGTEGAQIGDPNLDRYLHLACLNRGVLMTPFHSMALLSPSHTESDVDLHSAVFGELVDQLLG